MNTRIQVEHPVTEMVTDVRPGKKPAPASRRRTHGHRSSTAQSSTAAHAIECRINAEKPRTPSSRQQARSKPSNPPGGHRRSPSTRPGFMPKGVIPPYYDSLIAKTSRPRQKTGTKPSPACPAPLEMFIIEGIFHHDPPPQTHPSRPRFSAQGSSIQLSSSAFWRRGKEK